MVYFRNWKIKKYFKNERLNMNVDLFIKNKIYLIFKYYFLKYILCFVYNNICNYQLEFIDN